MQHLVTQCLLIIMFTAYFDIISREVSAASRNTMSPDYHALTLLLSL